MKFEACDVPYRRWRKIRFRRSFHLVQTNQSKRLMKVMGKATKEGKAVQFTHAVIASSDAGGPDGAVYDTISLTIAD